MLPKRPLVSLALLLLGLWSGCEREGGIVIGDAGADATGRLRVLLTDAPLDDADVAGVYLTITGVTVDGETLPHLATRSTVDLAAYTAGRTVQYGTDQSIRAGVYAGLAVMLDLERDASGRAPGAYVATADGGKAALGFGPRTLSVPVDGRFEVRPDAVTEVVVDVDLRRAITYGDDGGYTLGDAARLGRSLRVVEEATSGSADGTIVDHGARLPAGAVRVVYAFPRGRAEAEALRAGDFEAAITSARVGPTGRFRLSYLPAGRYELVAVDYADTDGDGRLDLLGPRASDAAVGADTRAVTISAAAQTTVEMTLGDRLR